MPSRQRHGQEGRRRRRKKILEQDEFRFWMKLALAFGVPVFELMERMDSAEFGYWIAYSNVDPFGEEIADLRAGTVASTIANCHRTRGAAFKPSDFMVRRGEKPEPRKQTTKQMMQIMDMFTAAQNEFMKQGG